MKQDKLVFSSALSAILTIVALTAITIGAEFSAPFKDYLKNFTGHHWITKSYATVLFYLVFWYLAYALTKRLGPGKVALSFYWMSAVLFAGGLAIFIFYVWHYLLA